MNTRMPVDGPLWGDNFGLAEDRARDWPTAEQLKRQHLEALQCAIEDLKDAQLDQQMQDEWAQMEQELPKS